MKWPEHGIRANPLDRQHPTIYVIDKVNADDADRQVLDNRVGERHTEAARRASKKKAKPVQTRWLP